MGVKGVRVQLGSQSQVFGLPALSKARFLGRWGHARHLQAPQVSLRRLCLRRVVSVLFFLRLPRPCPTAIGEPAEPSAGHSTSPRTGSWVRGHSRAPAPALASLTCPPAGAPKAGPGRHPSLGMGLRWTRPVGPAEYGQTSCQSGYMPLLLRGPPAPLTEPRPGPPLSAIQAGRSGAGPAFEATCPGRPISTPFSSRRDWLRGGHVFPEPRRPPATRVSR